jgi:hypothetical protein
MAAQDRIRIGDAERETVAAALREHYAHGRLTLDEFGERLDATFAARTAGDLRAVTVDLPGQREAQAAAVPGRSPGRPPGPGGRRPRGRGGAGTRRSGPAPVPLGLVALGLWLAVAAGHAWWLLALLPLVVFVATRRLRRHGAYRYGAGPGCRGRVAARTNS